MSVRTIEEASSVYAKVVYWEVWNFMSIKHARVDFDENNIVNLKGYNDSGKSALLRALDVLLFDIKPNQQVNFIMDGEEYFRIVCYFADGVTILRDKYFNGQSLYEMYKGSDLLYSTKNGKVLTKVQGVPDPIKSYLGLVYYDDVIVNSRSCFEKQLGVQSTGSENYKMFNTTLRSEEIYVASNTLNNDKNALGAKITQTANDLNYLTSTVAEGANLTAELVDWLKSSDEVCDCLTEQTENLKVCMNLSCSVSSIVELPEIELLNGEQVTELGNIINLYDYTNKIPRIEIIDGVDDNELLRLSDIFDLLEVISFTPETEEISVIDAEQLSMLTSIESLLLSSSSDSSVSEISELDFSRISDLMLIANILSAVRNIDTAMLNDEREIEQLQKLLKEYEVEMEEVDASYVRCPSCGNFFLPEEACC